MDIFFEAEVRSFWNFQEIQSYSREKKGGHQIKVVRFGRGGEFTSKKFQTFCEANEIRHPLTVLWSPQQSNISERNDKIILNMARSMLKSKKIAQRVLGKSYCMCDQPI